MYTNMVTSFIIHIGLSLFNLAFLGLATLLIEDTAPSAPLVRTNCPCSDTTYCRRVDTTYNREVFLFSLGRHNSSWPNYDWTKITTIVLFGYIDMDLVCLAHKYNTHAVALASFPIEVLSNETAKSAWIASQLLLVNQHFLDGVNFDFESEIFENQTSLKQNYTQLVADTYKTFKQFDPNLQVTVDVAWSPECIDNRCYDYLGLSKVSDFLFIMAYDEQSQMFEKECLARPNSDYQKTVQGIEAFLHIGVYANKLVLGVPWYGRDYPCLTLSQSNECSIKKIPWRGVACTDSPGKEIDYKYTVKLLKNSTSGRLWDDKAKSPYFNYRDTETSMMYQMRYDDPESLKYKYELANYYNLKGVGVWQIEAVDYVDTDPLEVTSRKLMWGALPTYKTHG